MPNQLHGLSSMATRGLLADLSHRLANRHAVSVRFESAGGVDIARRIRAGASADLAVLGHEALSELAADGYLLTDPLALYVSDVVAAVPDDRSPPPLSTEDELRTALTNADRIAYSTGPSGEALLALLERWGLASAVRPKLIRARPGNPVGALLASRDADLGFQQRSEFAGLTRVRVLGALPGRAAIRSTFSGAVIADSKHAEPARETLRLLRAADAEQTVLAAGMTIAESAEQR